MVAAAELPGEREVVFPKIAAPAGMRVIDKQVWRIGRRQAVWLMPLAATAGRLIARIAELPAPGDIARRFSSPQARSWHARNSPHHRPIGLRCGKIGRAFVFCRRFCYICENAK